MGLLETIKSLLGLGSNRRRGREETNVTVEREAADEEAAADSPVAAETDATASTDSLVDEDRPADEAAEPGEAVGPATDDPDEAAPAAEGDPDEAASAAEGEPVEAAPAAEGEPVEVVRGIGPAYGERLAGEGIETVPQLAAADPVDLADRIAVSESRVRRWVERARERTE
jgi:predicted flap endonuclease-1-like 5' DNA nuclease